MSSMNVAIIIPTLNRIDFIMRTCLVLLDLPILFKVRSFGTKTINNINIKWDDICRAIDETVDLLVDFGFDGKTLTSRNAVIPLVYYVYKGGRIKDNERKNWKKYLQHTMMTGFFGSHGDQALANLRNYLRKENGQGVFILTRKSFSFENLKQNLHMTGKTLEITEEDIDDFLEYKKGRQAFVVLSLLYPNLQYNEIKFDQDHIHPAVMFRLRNLRKLGLDDKTIERWIEMKDQIPNLQMMEERKNRVKNRTPFQEWLQSKNESETLNSSPWTLVWSDEFDSDVIDLQKWNKLLWRPGWVNNESQAYTARDTNLFVRNGKLVIRGLIEPGLDNTIPL